MKALRAVAIVGSRQGLDPTVDRNGKLDVGVDRTTFDDSGDPCRNVRRGESYVGEQIVPLDSNSAADE